MTAPPRSHIAALALLALFPSRSPQAMEAGWTTTATTVARMNPLALGAEAELAYQRHLYDASHPLLASNHERMAVAVQVTPASLGPALRFELQPLSVLVLGVAYAPVFYLGTCGMAQSYPSPRARLGGGAFRQVEEGPGGAYALTIHELLLQGALQGRVGAFSARAQVEATRVEATLHGQDRVLYDAARDILVYRRGWVAEGNLDLVWTVRDDWMVGARATTVTAWYPPDAFATGDRGGLGERTTLRAGPVTRWRLFQGRGGLVDEGALVAVAQWWLAHPDRAGRTSPQAVPLALVLVQVSGAP